MRHRSVEKTIVGIYVTDTHVSGDVTVRIVSGGKGQSVHTVDISSNVAFDRTEKDEFGVPVTGKPTITWSVDAALEHLMWQLNARANEVATALETLKAL